MSGHVDTSDEAVRATIAKLRAALVEARDWAKGFAHPKQPILARIDAALNSTETKL